MALIRTVDPERTIRGWRRRAGHLVGVSLGSAAAGALAVLGLMRAVADPQVPALGPATVSEPVEACGDQSVLLPRLEAAYAAYLDAYGDPERFAIFDALDEIAVAMLCSQPDQLNGMLEARLDELPHVGHQVRVVDLRRDERLIMWTGVDGAGQGGGRATVLVRDELRWRRLGYVDADDITSSFGLIGVDHDTGIAVLGEDYVGNGWPPARSIAVAVAGDRVVTADTGLVQSIDADSGDVWPEVLVGRRPDLLNRYMDGELPLRISRWRVDRRGDGLHATEEPLTPWVDALAAYCSGAHPEIAEPSVRARVEACVGSVSDLRWTAKGHVVARLPLRLWCQPYDDKSLFEVESREDAQLTLAQRRGTWRVVSATSCE